MKRFYVKMEGEPGAPGGAPPAAAPPAAAPPAPAAAPPAAAPAAAPNAAPPAPAASTDPVLFDWTSVAGMEDASMNVVKTRQWADPNAVVQSYINLEKLAGVPPERLVKIPEGDNKPEWDVYYSKIGKPAAAADYVIPVNAGDDGKFAEVARNWLFEANIPQSMATPLIAKWNEYVATLTTDTQNQVSEKHEAEMTELKAEWSTEFENRALVVDAAADEFGMTPEQLTGLKTAMGAAGTLRFLYAIGKRIATPSNGLINGEPMRNNDVTQGMTPGEAIAEIARLTKDSDFSKLFLSSDDKTRSEARATMSKLHKVAYPGEHAA